MSSEKNYLNDSYKSFFEDSLSKKDPELYKAINAELIRQLDSYAPGSYNRFRELSTVADQTKVPRASMMIEELLEDTNKMLDLTKRMFTVAEQENEQGIADFIADRIDAFAKHAWMMRSFLKARD